MRRAILIAIIFAVVTACLFAQETQNNRGGINITSSKTKNRAALRANLF